MHSVNGIRCMAGVMEIVDILRKVCYNATQQADAKQLSYDASFLWGEFSG